MRFRRVVIAALVALACLAALGTVGAQARVRLVLKDLDSDPNAGAFIDLIEKGMAAAGTRVDIQLQQTPAGDYAQKIALMVLSGDVPDLIYFQGGDETLSDQGVLEDLRPYLARSRYIGRLQDPHSATRVANYPYIVWLSPPRVRTPVMRKDWFDTLATARAVQTNPTVDTYYALFRDLVASKRTKYGIAITGATNGVEELDAIFDAAYGNTSTWLRGTDGKWSFARVSANERTKLEFYAKLYREGLLDPEYLTKRFDTKEQAFYEGSAGMIVGVSPGSVDVYVNKMMKAQGVDLISLPPPKGVGQGLTPFVDVTKEPRGFAISATSRVKDSAFAILDFLWSPAGEKIAKLGIPGIHYTETATQYVIQDKYSEWLAGWFGDSWNGFSPDKPLSRPLVNTSASDSGALAKRYMLSDHNFLMPSQYATNWDAMTNLYKEYAADIVTGKKPIGAFGELVERWNRAGGVDVTRYANTVLK
jgi:putative aldouronate transport system substrate-binding protein